MYSIFKWKSTKLLGKVNFIIKNLIIILKKIVTISGVQFVLYEINNKIYTLIFHLQFLLFSVLLQ